MDASQNLLTIAELALGLAGFTGIVGAVQSGAHITSRQAAFRIRQLLETSLGVLFYAFIPLILLPLFPSTIAWRLSNFLLAIAHWMTMMVSLRRAEQVGGAVVGKRGLFLDLMLTGGVLTIILNLVAGFDAIPSDWQAPVYMLGLLYLLLVASHTFVKLLMYEKLPDTDGGEGDAPAAPITPLTRNAA